MYQILKVISLRSWELMFEKATGNFLIHMPIDKERGLGNERKKKSQGFTYTWGT